MNIIKLFLLFIGLTLLFGSASAGLIYDPSEPYLVLTSPAPNDFPSLYQACVAQFGETTARTIINETSPGTWQMIFLIIPKDVPFYINGSTAAECHLTGNYRDWGIQGYAYVNNTKIVGWNKTFNKPEPTSSIVLYYPAHDVIFDHIKNVYFGYNTASEYLNPDEISNCSIYNITIKNAHYGMSIQSGDNLTVTNITVKDGDPILGQGIVESSVNNSTFSEITISNVSQPTDETSAYGLQLSGSNNIIRDVYINGTAYSATNFGGYDVYNSTNLTVENMTIYRYGHNGLEVEMNNSHFKNIIIGNGNRNNIYQVGRAETGKTVGNNFYENIISYSPKIGFGSTFEEGSFNTIIQNGTFNGKGIDIYNAKNITCINCTQSGASGYAGWYLTQIDYGGLFAYNQDHSLIDSKLSNNPFPAFDIEIEVGDRTSFINTNFSTTWLRYGSGYTLYYYPNITVKNVAGLPLKDAIITFNTTAKNGYGKNQIEFITDSNGKLYDSGNRSNWAAIPDGYTYTDQNNGITHISNTITEITATKSGQTDSEIVDPSTSWYSENLSSLSGPEIVLTLDNQRTNLWTTLVDFL